MPTRKAENIYRGVNAHLHSYFQQKTGWAGFHSMHVADLTRALKELLPVSSGYAVLPEQSLQIAQYDLATDETRLSRMKPDVLLYQVSESTDVQPLSPGVASPTMIVPLETLEPETISSVVIYEVREQNKLGKPVTRIELLSPANKPPGSHYGTYLQKRDLTLQSGIKLVEIDYLHERRSPALRVPDYTQQQAQSTPYAVLVSALSGESGQTAVYGFRVDDPIPTVEIPLAGDDRIALDLNAIYQRTYALDDVYSLVYVDYEQSPENFDAYDSEDQQRIQAVMARAKG